MNKSDLINWFMTKFPKHVKAMKGSDHNYNLMNLNPYHLEGDVFCHSCMVLKQANGDINVQLSALLHDLGKPSCEERKDDTKRVRYFGHESVSAFLALSVLDQFTKDFPKVIINKPLIFQIIALHTEPFKIPDKLNDRLVNQSAHFIMCLQQLNEADEQGRYHLDKKERSWLGQVYQKTTNKGSKTATVLIGLPCAGKSTYVNQEVPEGTIRLSRDQVIIDTVEGETYDDKWRTLDRTSGQKAIDKEYNRRKTEAIRSGADLVFDRTNLSRKSRRKQIASLPKDYIKKAVVFLPTMEELHRRNEMRSAHGKSIPKSTLDKMMKAFYPPLYDEFDIIEWRF